MPINLAPDLSTVVDQRIEHCLSYLPGLLWISLLACAWWRRRAWGGPVLMLIVCYTALLLPVLGFVNITFMQYSLVADHWQYIAMIVPYAVVMQELRRKALVSRRFLRRWVAISAAGALLLVLAALSWRQCEMYRRGRSRFMRRRLLEIPNACWPKTTWATLWRTAGSSKRPLFILKKRCNSTPISPEAHTNFAAALADHGQFDEAIAHYRKALEIKPDLAETHHTLALALDHQGQFDAAIFVFEKAEQFTPGLAAIHGSFAAAAADHGQFDRAIAEYDIALQIKRDDAAFAKKNARPHLPSGKNF